jgi:hypothetical protein
VTYDQALKYLQYRSVFKEKIADIYDCDRLLRDAVAIVCPDFEYPDHSYKTVAEFLRKYQPQEKRA